MWVLSTDRAELHSFPSPEDVPDGYAALSHVWNTKPEDGPREQSFKDVRRIQKRYCIDKTSSAELSEAVNSMFRCYTLARICYGYLRDIPFLEDIDGADADYFMQAKWFRRGWTLQELIAPRFFLFVSKSWEVLGSQADFARVIEDGSSIPAALLRCQVAHTEFSIAQRMSWFGPRETTRLEDEAYCLLGLFDIHMPTLYGEGRNAFRRLQEEILKHSKDTTIFAWAGLGLNEQERSCLLAPSPSAFSPIKIMYKPMQLTQDRSHGRTTVDSALDRQVEL